MKPLPRRHLLLLSATILACGACSSRDGEREPDPGDVLLQAATSSTDEATQPGDTRTSTPSAARAESDADHARDASHDWPVFRGPGRSGVAPQAKIPQVWSDVENVRWKTKLPGPGASSPIVFGDHVYVTCHSGYGVPGTAGGKDDLVYHLVCLKRDTGEILWDAKQPARGEVVGFEHFVKLHGFATSTPVADESGVYAFYSTSGLFACTHDGTQRWRRDCGTSAHGADGWGSGSSPVTWRGNVIVHADVESTAIYSFTKSGDLAWKRTFARGNQNTRATPLVAALGGQDQLVFHSTMGTLTSLDPATGETLWEYRGTKAYQNPSPVTDGERLYVLSYGQALALDARGRKVWEANLGSEVGTPLLHDGRLYWASEEGGLAYCLDADTGQVVYRERLVPTTRNVYASGVLADGRIYYASRDKGTYVVAAKPGFQLLARNAFESDDSVVNATPAISGNALFLRSNAFLYCIADENP